MAGPLESGEARADSYLPDRRRIYLAKSLRAVAYGALSGFLVIYLIQNLGYSALSSLLITSLTLVGAAAWNLLALPRVEARVGRRRSLYLFSGLFVFSAALLYLGSSPGVVIFATLVGGVAAATADNSPLGSIEQAILPSITSAKDRAAAFAWYNLLASFAAAAGGLLLIFPGALSPTSVPFLPPAPHPPILLAYVVLAIGSVVVYIGLSPAVEAERPPVRQGASTLSSSTRSHLVALSALFGVDAFAGGMVVNPVIVTYFVTVWNASSQEIGVIITVVGTVSALSFLLASALARRFGLLPTMVFTHLPSNVMLALVPFMPTFALAFGMLTARSALSQMDVPTRQAYTMELVRPEERTEVAATLNGTRGATQSVGPFPAVALQAAGLWGAPFVLAGSLKAVYDLALWRRFRRVQVGPPELPDEHAVPAR